MFFESVKMALSSLRGNKMRSLLTMLGIIVGIAAVIAIVSLGEGGKEEILGQFEQIGASTTIVQVRTNQARPEDFITQADVRAIRENVESVRHVSASWQNIGFASSRMDRRRAFISAIDEDFTRFTPIDIIHGRFFTQIEYMDGFPVSVIDTAGAIALFGRENVVGETLDIENRGRILQTTIIGVCESVASQFAAFGGFGGNGDDERTFPFFIYTPFNSARGLISGNSNFSSINVMSVTPERVDEAAASTIRLLEMRKGNYQRQVYTSQNLASILEQIDNVINIMTVFISAVAAISLIVGGIGVMNIMLVSVTERTKEIGIRKALGGTTWDILLQFITESVVLTMFGGILGIIAGLGLARGIAYGIAYSGIGNITPVLSIQSIVIAVIFSSAVGLFFGIYPARKAALLNPIDALRYE